MMKLTPLEQQLQQYAPVIFALHMLMKDEMDGGGGERNLVKLIETVVSYNQTGGTGRVQIGYSEGKISHIDSTVRLTHGNGLPKNHESD